MSTKEGLLIEGIGLSSHTLIFIREGLERRGRGEEEERRRRRRRKREKEKKREEKKGME